MDTESIATDSPVEEETPTVQKAIDSPSPETETPIQLRGETEGVTTETPQEEEIPTVQKAIASSGDETQTPIQPREETQSLSTETPQDEIPIQPREDRENIKSVTRDTPPVEETPIQRREDTESVATNSPVEAETSIQPRDNAISSSDSLGNPPTISAADLMLSAFDGDRRSPLGGLFEDTPIEDTQPYLKPDSNSNIQPPRMPSGLEENYSPSANLPETIPDTGNSNAFDSPESPTSLEEWLGKPSDLLEESPITDLISLRSPFAEAENPPVSEKDGDFPRDSTEALPTPPAGAKVAIGDREFEGLARKVYGLIRLQFEAERERQNETTAASLPWFDAVSQMSVHPDRFSVDATPNPVAIDRHLERLVTEVGHRLRHRLYLDRERSGL